MFWYSNEANENSQDFWRGILRLDHRIGFDFCSSSGIAIANSTSSHGQQESSVPSSSGGWGPAASSVEKWRSCQSTGQRPSIDQLRSCVRSWWWWWLTFKSELSQQTAKSLCWNWFSFTFPGHFSCCCLVIVNLISGCFSEPCENLSSGIIDGEGPDLLKAILTADPDIFKSGSVYRNSGQFNFLVWKWWVVGWSEMIAEENRDLIVELNFCAHVTYSFFVVVFL